MDIETIYNNVESVLQRSQSDGRYRRKTYLRDNLKESAEKKWSIESLGFAKVHPEPDSHIITVNESSDKNDEDCFHRAIGPFLQIAQFIGYLPIINVRAHSVEQMKFKKFSKRSIYAYFILFIMGLMMLKTFIYMYTELEHIRWAFTVHYFLKNLIIATSSFIYYVNSFLSYFLFLKHCAGWILLQHEWRAMERKLDELNVERPRLCRKFKIIGGILLSAALMDSIIFLVNNIYQVLVVMEDDSKEHTIKDWVNMVMQEDLNYEWKQKNYHNVFLGICTFMATIMVYYTCYFRDLFLILVSVGITDRYKYLNKCMIEKTKQELASTDWHEVRKCYVTLSTLVKKVDKEISGIILLSYCDNLYFIYLNIFHFGIMKRALRHFLVYFNVIFANFLLFSRSIGVTLALASVNDNSKIVAPAIYNCPGDNYTLETQRLQHQIATDSLALTGKRFFFITRNFFLAIIGAFMAYQVVMVESEFFVRVA